MSKTQGVLLTELAARLGDPGMTYFSPIELRTWINEGAREIARRTECLRAVATTAVTAGTQSYTAPTDAVRIHKVEFKPTSDSRWFSLEHRDMSAADIVWGTQRAITQSYAPEFWTGWGYPGSTNFTVELYPTPSSAGTLRFQYYKLPTDLSVTGSAAGTPIDCPNGWEDVILDWAETRAELKRKDVNAYQIKDAIFKDHLMAIMETSIRYTDSPGEITFDPQWFANQDGY